ncbi:MAG TPA: hypothetical protein VFO39_21450 [Candidatus Sulfotelmatobacter sp.]|nr:hypothetical protein [Candidatus Sulfotelmatobacter sp.]
MLEGLFRPLHLLILLVVAVILFGVPLLLIFRLAQWLDKRLQLRKGVRISFVAVALGGITAFVASAILTLPVIIYVIVRYDLLHAPEGSAATAYSIHSSAWLYGALAIGIGCYVVGGYIAARIAKHDELLNGLLSSFVYIPFGMFSVFSGRDSQWVFMRIFPVISAPAFALLGGYLRQVQKRMGSRPGMLGPSPEAH